jgi:hypothetical protein
LGGEIVKIRDRIKDFRRVKASQLRPNPLNWRIHPQAQQDALRGVLAEVGYADALLARELPDGSLELLGHVETESAAVEAMLNRMLGKAGSAIDAADDEPATEIGLRESFQVVIECQDEDQQRSVYERLTGEGLSCRLLTL